MGGGNANSDFLRERTCHTNVDRCGSIEVARERRVDHPFAPKIAMPCAPAKLQLRTLTGR